MISTTSPLFTAKAIWLVIKINSKILPIYLDRFMNVFL